MSKIITSLVHHDEARVQFLNPRGEYQNSRDFLQTLVTLSKSEWHLLDTTERRQVASNCLQSLKLLTSDRKNLERVFLDYPELLLDS